MRSQNLKQSKSTFDPAVHLKLGTFVFDDTYPEYPEGGVCHFTNGLGLHMIAPKFRLMVETIIKRERFLKSGWRPTAELIALPFVWYQPRGKDKLHFFGDCFRVCKILSREIGFKNVFQYLQTRGWTLKKHPKDEGYTLQYRKLEDCIGRSDAEVDGSGINRCRHVRAMVQSLYQIVQGEIAIDPVTKKPAVKFLAETSFRNKLNNVVQSLHEAYIVYLVVFEPCVCNPNLVEEWIVKIFAGCWTKKAFVNFINDILSLFSGSAEEQGQVKDLVKHHLPNLRTEIARLADGKAFKESHRISVEAQLNKHFPRGCKNVNRPLHRNLAIVMSRARDATYPYMNHAEKNKFKSCTRHTKSLSNSKNKKATAKRPVSEVVTTSDNSPVSKGDQPWKRLKELSMLGSLLNQQKKPSGSIVNVASVTPVAKKITLNEFDARFDFTKFTLATNEDLQVFKSRLMVHLEDEILVVFDSDCYFYEGKKFGERDHSYDVYTPLPCLQSSEKTVSTIGPSASSTNKEDMVVLRSNHSTFQKCFAQLQFDYATVTRFVLEHGHTNTMREGMEQNGQRIEVGCCGQVPNKLDDGTHEPKETFGFHVFKPDTNSGHQAEEVKASLAEILDACQDAQDQVHAHHLNIAMAFNYKPRTEKYGRAAREAIGATRTRQELFTVIVKCLSRGDCTMNHKDTKDCTWSGYENTTGFVLNFRDGLGDIWSLRILTNSRAQIGAYFDKRLDLREVKSNIRGHLQRIDHFFLTYNMPYREEHTECNFRTFHKVPLNEVSPWEWVDIGEGIRVERIVFPSMIVRDFALSAAATVLHDANTRFGRKHAIELAVIAGLVTGWHRFYYMYVNKIQHEASKQCPGLRLIRILKAKFGNIVGDTYVGKNRISPPGLDMEEVFVKNDRFNDNMDLAVKEIDKILCEVKKESFNRFSLVDHLKEAKEKMKPFGMNMGEFRILLSVQTCLLAGLSGTGSKKWINLQYPINKLGAETQLQGVPTDLRPSALHHIMAEFGLTNFGLNSVETLLCETAENRNGYIHDYIIKGQSVFSFGLEGRPVLREYGSHHWKCVITGEQVDNAFES
eukprot:scaffold204047_cov46-Attheya_sp.AAC.1